MILLHHPEVELSRNLLAALPEGVEVIDCSTRTPEWPVSAYPSVVVDVPAYTEARPVLGADGEFLGMSDVLVPAHQELVRCPANWDAVASFVAYVKERSADLI